MVDYNYNDIKKAYRQLGVKKNRVVFVQSDLACLGAYEIMEKEAISGAHLRALLELLGKGGTIVVSTPSLSLCNTDIPFDLKRTPSEGGILSEYVRRYRGALRSFHPFVSFAAIGKDAREICSNVSRHSFGPETPMVRMIDRDTLFLSLGFHPSITCQTIHQVEMDMGVPYRYVREYMHPVVRKSGIEREPFYMYVWYYECNIKKNDNVEIWHKFQAGNEVKEAMLGRGKIYSYSMCEFYRCGVDFLKDNLYRLLEEVPRKKPYSRKM